MRLKLSEYLGHLNQEVVRGRMQGDLRAIEVAKAYASDKLLRHFSAPHYLMPLVRMDIPVRVSSAELRHQYQFRFLKEDFVSDFNQRLNAFNRVEGLRIPLFKADELPDQDMEMWLERLQEEPETFRDDLDTWLDKSIEAAAWEKIFIRKNAVKKLPAEQRQAIRAMSMETMKTFFVPIRREVKDIIFDTGGAGQGSNDMVINIHVEMLDEGFRLMKTDENEPEIVFG
ncbi:MAG: hypothetical protein AAF206_13110 [Bacteroidota bacterium]